MVQLYSPPAARGLPSRLQGSLFEDRTVERIWTCTVQYFTAGLEVAQLLSKCPQTLVEVVSSETVLTHQPGPERLTTHTFELPSEVSIAELDDLLLWFKGFKDVPVHSDVKGDTRAALIFPPSLTKQDRALLHTQAQGAGLFSESTGVAAARHIKITVVEQGTGLADQITTHMSTLTCGAALDVPLSPDISAEGGTPGSLPSESPANVAATGNGGEKASSVAAASMSSTTASESKLAGEGEQSGPAESASQPGPVGSKPGEPTQGKRQKPAASGAGAAGRGQANGRGAGGGMAGRARNGVQLSFAEQLYAWCREAGGGYLEYSRGELQEMVATGGALPPPLQQLSDLRACGDRLFKRISLRDEAGAIAVLESAPLAVVWLKDDSGCAPVHRAAYLGLLAVLEVLIEMQPGLLESRDYNYWNPLQVATHAGRLDAVSLIMQKTARLSSGHQQHGRQQQGFYNQQQQQHAFHNQQMAFNQQGAYQQQQQGMYNLQQQQQAMYSQQQAMYGQQQGQFNQQQGGGGYEGSYNQQQHGRYSSNQQGGGYSSSPQTTRQQHAQQNAAKKQLSDTSASSPGQSSPSPSPSPQQVQHRPSASPPPPPLNSQQKPAVSPGSLPGPASSAAVSDAASTDASPSPVPLEQRQRNNTARNAPIAGQQQQAAPTEPRQARQPRQPQGSSKTTLSATGSSSDLQSKEGAITQSSAADQKLPGIGGGSGTGGKSNRPTSSLPSNGSADQLQTLPGAAGTDASGTPIPNFYKDAARVVGRADRQNGWRRTEPLPPSPPPPALPTGEAGGDDGPAGGGEDTTAVRSELQAPKTPPLPTGPPAPTGFTFGRASRLQPPPGTPVALPAAPGSSPVAAAVASTAVSGNALSAASAPSS